MNSVYYYIQQPPGVSYKNVVDTASLAKSLSLQMKQEHNKKMRSAIKDVKWNHRACIVVWNDGTQTKAIWDPQEPFDPEKAILVCMAKKLYGGNIFNEVLKKYSPEGFDHYYANLMEDMAW